MIIKFQEKQEEKLNYPWSLSNSFNWNFPGNLSPENFHETPGVNLNFLKLFNAKSLLIKF